MGQDKQITEKSKNTPKSIITSKQWKELTFSNDFIFAKVMLNPELCKGVLERLLRIKIHHLEYLEEQKVIDIAKDSKSIRLDVYVADEKGTIFNIEMQVINTKNIPKRTRFYQSMIDLNSLEKGMNYAELPQSFVIFICKFDPFGKGLYKYTFVNTCKEDSSLTLEDSTTKLFFNSTGKITDTDPDLEAFLKFVENGIANDAFTKRLETEVETVKQNKKWRVEYMTLLLREQDKFIEGKAEGKAEGIINSYLDFGCTNDDILSCLQQKLGISKVEAEHYLERYYQGNL